MSIAEDFIKAKVQDASGSLSYIKTRRNKYVLILLFFFIALITGTILTW